MKIAAILQYSKHQLSLRISLDCIIRRADVQAEI